MLDRPTNADRKRERSRLVKRAWRSRLKAGGAVLTVPIADINGLTGVLMDLHWLAEDRSEDRTALVIAVGALLDDLARSRGR